VSDFDIRKIDLAKLNSLTKYPSIPTYHELGDRGTLKDVVGVQFDGAAIVTEKVDGTSGRVICCPDGTMIVGSREELLWARGDLIENTTLRIVESVKPYMENIRAQSYPNINKIVVHFFEVYGAKVSPGKASKNYTAGDATGCRLFDVAVLVDSTWQKVMAMDRSEISHWREGGGQHFVSMEVLREASFLTSMPCVPNRGFCTPPATIDEAVQLMREYWESKCPLDTGLSGHCEGIVIRSSDRKKIAKLRFEDYEKTIKARERVSK
jgi:hypothetical protein